VGVDGLEPPTLPTRKSGCPEPTELNSKTKKVHIAVNLFFCGS
jgi:hypothetical protein